MIETLRLTMKERDILFDEFLHINGVWEKSNNNYKGWTIFRLNYGSNKFEYFIAEGTDCQIVLRRKI